MSTRSYFFHIGNAPESQEFSGGHSRKISCNKDIENLVGILGFVKIKIFPGWEEAISITAISGIFTMISCNMPPGEIELHCNPEPFKDFIEFMKPVLMIR